MRASGVLHRAAVLPASFVGHSVGRAALRRWALLILGGALVTPFWFVANVVTGLFVHDVTPWSLLAVQLGDFAAALPVAAAAAALLPLVRPLEIAAARTLLDTDLPDNPGTGSRARTAAWCTLHLGLGGLVAGATLAIPPAVVLLAVRPLIGPDGTWADRVPLAAGPVVAALLLLLLLCAVRGAGAVLSRAAEPLLGPSAADRLAEAELRGRKLAERNRLARELHDSVGHALSVVTLQAAAAGRLLGSDPAFTRSALAAIEETARGALDELDHVLGLLRDEESRRSPLPDLRDVDHLVESARAAGAHVEISMGALGDVPPAVSREAYRIVQEALTNALKHAPAAPVRVGLATPPRSAALAITVANPLPRQRRSSEDAPVRSGGRGVPGVQERAALLGGQADIGPRADEWVVQVRLPWEKR